MELLRQTSFARPLKLRSRWYTPCMAKLDNLPWIDAFAVSGYGVRIGVRVDDRALIPVLRARPPPGAKIAPLGTVDRMLSIINGGAAARRGLKKYHLLYADHVLAARSHDLETVLDRYDAHLRIGIAQLSRHKLFVHAGVVAWKGKAILLPGRTLAGKTHLVAELVKAGATYFSDEYAVLDREGLVHPFAKPLSMRSDKTARQIETPVEKIGGIAGRTMLPVGLVVMSRYEAGARWRPARLTPGHGMLALLENTFSARLSPELAMSVLRQVVTGATVLRSKRGEAGGIADQILRFAEGLQQEPSHRGDLEVVDARQ